MANSDLLEVVNERDEVVAHKTKTEIHRNGLLHREVHIWMYTPQGELVFQHRAKDKDSWPDKYDAAIGGHVEIGESYMAAAIREAKEEAGLSLKPPDLELFEIQRKKHQDPGRSLFNNTYRAIYLYCYKGRIENLQIEIGKAQGFVPVPISGVLNPDEELKRYLILDLLKPIWRPMLERISVLSTPKG